MEGTIKKEAAGTYEGLVDFCNDNTDKYIHLINLFKAILEVEDKYYSYSTKHLNGSDAMQEHLERVFAYELYHQWSILIRDFNNSHNDEDKRVINGEVGKKLDGYSVCPDMILHKGQEDTQHQEIAVEIKRKISLSEDNFLNDMEKLSDMLTDGKLSFGASPFKFSVFILTGGEESNITSLLNKEKAASINNNIICIFCHKKGELDYKSMDEIKKSIK